MPFPRFLRARACWTRMRGKGSSTATALVEQREACRDGRPLTRSAGGVLKFADDGVSDDMAALLFSAKLPASGARPQTSLLSELENSQESASSGSPCSSSRGGNSDTNLPAAPCPKYSSKDTRAASVLHADCAASDASAGRGSGLAEKSLANIEADIRILEAQETKLRKTVARRKCGADVNIIAHYEKVLAQTEEQLARLRDLTENGTSASMGGDNHFNSCRCPH